MDRSLQIKRRIKIILSILVCMHAFIVLRAVYVEQVHGADLRRRQITQSKRIIPLQSRRGYIYDRNGNKLAMDVPFTSIFAIPSMIKEKKRYAAELSAPLGIPAEFINTELDKKKKPFVWLKRFVSEDTAQKVRDLNLKGVVLIRESKRVYPNGTMAAQVVGFMGEEKGVEGIEMTFDNKLRGRDGYILLEKDPLGRNIPQSIREKKPVQNGSDVFLTLDMTIQHFAEEELRRTVEKFNARGGAAIVLNPRTGRILAMASNPSFDPNRFRDYVSDPTVFRNRVIWYLFEPGSIMKPLVVSTALDMKVIDPFKATIYCEPVFFVAGKPIKDDHGVDIPNMKTPVYVIAHSSNTGAAKVALMIGPEGIKSVLNRFHFTSGYKLPLNGAQQALLPNLNKMSDLTVADNGFGYALSVTMLQMAMATSAIANDGVLMKPGIVDRVVDQDGTELYSFSPKPIRRSITAETAKLMRYMMHMVVEEGTGKNAQIPGYTVAGKTGTAKVVRGGRYQNEYFASFVGYAPVEDPQLVVMVTIERPTPVYYAAAVAAPAFREIMMKSLWHLNVPPSPMDSGPVGY